MSFELDRIEELCNDRGWSHYRLAKEMEISPNSIGNLFPPNHCAQYSYHPSYMPGFWYLHERIFTAQEGSQAILSKQQEYVLNLYNQLGPSNRLRAEAYLEGLVDGSYRKKRKKKEKE